MATDEFLEQTYSARDQFVNGLGSADPDVLAPLINPSFMGGPMWPDLRQAWRVVRSSGTAIVLSDGLSDPFSDDDDPNVGFGIEIVAESPDAMPAQMRESWLFDLVYQVSQQCAAHGGVGDLIEELGMISLELPVSDALKDVATSDDGAGVLLGVASPNLPQTVTLPGGVVRLITAKLLWPSELEHAATHGKKGRENLAKKFAADGTHHQSSLSRRPVV